MNVARIVSQALAGIQLAHEHGVTHGDLQQSDFVLSDDDTVKIRHLAVSTLRAPRIDGESDDIKAIAKIGQQLLAAIPSDQDENRLRLENYLQTLSAASPAEVDQVQTEIDDWVNAEEGRFSFDQNEILASEHDHLPAVDRASFSESADSSTLDEDDEEYEDEDDEDEYDDEYFDEEEPGFLGRLAKENPVGLIATLLVLAAMLVGGTATGTYWYVTSTATAKKIAAAKTKTVNQTAAVPKKQVATSSEPKPQPAQKTKTDGALARTIRRRIRSSQISMTPNECNA